MPIINTWHRLNDPEATKHIPQKAGAYELANKYKTVIYIGHASFNTTARYRKIAGEEHREWYNRLWHGEDEG